MSEKTRLKFELVNKSGATVLVPGTYQKDKKDISLLRDGTVKSGTLSADDKRLIKKISVSSRTPYVDLFSPAEADFWREHNLVFVPGERGENRNKNAIENPVIRLIDEGEENKRWVNEKKASLAVANKVNNASSESLFNIAFGCGLITNKAAARHKTKEEIYRLVMDWAERFPAEFNNLVERDNREQVVVLNKAIALEIIEQDRGVFMYSQVSLGTSREEVLAYFEHHKDQYIMLRKKVVQADGLPVKYNDANVGDIEFGTVEAPAKSTNSKK